MRIFEQDGAQKKKMVVEGRSDFEDLGRDRSKTCSGSINDTIDCQYQNLSSTVQGIPDEAQVSGGYIQLQDRVPEIHNPVVMCREDGSSQNIGNVQINAVFLGNVANYEGSASKCVGETSGIRLRVKPEYNERTGTLWRPLSGEAEKENILGIQLQPLSLERVGSLKW